MDKVMTFAQTREANPWLTDRHLRRLVAERRVPFTKVGSKLLFRQADIDALVASNRVEVSPARAHETPDEGFYEDDESPGGVIQAWVASVGGVKRLTSRSLNL